MANTTKRVTFTKTRSYSFTVDYPNYGSDGGNVSDASILAAAVLPNGTCALGEMLAGSDSNLGVITNVDPPGAVSTQWYVGHSYSMPPYSTWSAKAAYAANAVIAPSVPAPFTVTAATAGYFGANEGMKPANGSGAVNATTMVVGNIYEIATTGSPGTDFVSCGALSNTVNGKFLCKSVPTTGNGTVWLLWYAPTKGTNSIPNYAADGIATGSPTTTSFTASVKTQTYDTLAAIAYSVGKILSLGAGLVRCIVAGTPAANPTLPTNVGDGFISGTAAFIRIK